MTMEVGEILIEGIRLNNQRKGREARQLLISLGSGRVLQKTEYEQLIPYMEIDLVEFGMSPDREQIEASLTEKGKALLGI